MTGLERRIAKDQRLGVLIQAFLWIPSVFQLRTAMQRDSYLGSEENSTHQDRLSEFGQNASVKSFDAALRAGQLH